MAYEPLIGQARMAKRMRMEMQCSPQWVLDLAAERDQLRAEVEALRAAITPQVIDWIGCGLAVNGRLVDGSHPALEKLISAMAAKEGA